MNKEKEHGKEHGKEHEKKYEKEHEKKQAPDHAECNQKIGELTQDLQRLQAEFENYKKRCDKDNQREIMKGLGGFVAKLLPIIDSLEIARRDSDGINLIYAQLYSMLEKEGLKRIPTEKFNPYMHEVMMTEETENPDEDHKIIEVFQTGYMLRDMILRPARVKIRKHVRPNQDQGQTQDR
ncbi:nucleotide exchange factor GrpE [Candidatus Woesearchaeota archaeon]|nr:nucleotide exchange factor GrpE [Candidatus Woesearchaeota archaeon]